MKKKKPTRPLLEPWDKKLVWITLIIALCCTILIPNPWSLTYSSIIDLLTNAIPLSLGVFMFLIPIGIYYGLSNKYKDEKERVRYFSHLKKALKEKSIIKFNAFYLPTVEGTKWDIFNATPLPIEKGIFIIERTYDNEIETEKHPISNLNPGNEHVINSELSSPMGAKWRVMLLTERGVRIDYPSVWFRKFKYF